jgi:hypothetical protein
MAFKEVQSLDADVTIALGGVNKKTGKANPKQVEGYYLGKRTTENKKAKDGTSNLYFFQTSKGNVGVWGKTDLDRKMGAVKLGAMTRITQSGMVPTPNGDMYKFKIEVDTDNLIEVSEALSATTTNSYSDEDTSYSETEEDSYGSYSDEEEETARFTAASSTNRKARVDELLKTSKGKV